MTWLRWCGRNHNQKYNSNMADVWANSIACHSRVTCHIGGCCHLANSMSWSQSYVSHCRVMPPGEFNGMSSQSHVLHCRVLPLSEFTVTIPEPHATLQGAVTWRNQCHDRAALQGVRIPSAILTIVFRHILFFVCLKWALTSSSFRIVSDTLVLMRVSTLKSNILNICYDVFLCNIMILKAYVTAVMSKLTYVSFSQGRVRTAVRRGVQFCCSFVANFLQYLCAKIYQNIMRFYRIIYCKNKLVQFFAPQCRIPEI